MREWPLVVCQIYCIIFINLIQKLEGVVCCTINMSILLYSSISSCPSLKLTSWNASVSKVFFLFVPSLHGARFDSNFLVIACLAGG